MRCFVYLMVAACAGQGGAPAAAGKGPQAANETIVDAGGSLPAQFPLEPIEVKQGEVVCYGFTEGAPNASLESLYATATASAREDYVRFIGVAAQHLDLQLQAAGQESAKVEETAQVTAKGSAVALGQPEKSWQKVERDGGNVLRVFVRFRIKRAEVENAFLAGIGGRQGKEGVVARTFSGLQAASQAPRRPAETKR